MKVRITEYLDIDLDLELWCCHRCGQGLHSAHESYKQGCLVYNRDPKTVYPPRIEGTYTFSPDPDWIRIVEFYCPGCGIMVENEFLPPGHPITDDIRIDLAALKRRFSGGKGDPNPAK